MIVPVSAGLLNVAVVSFMFGMQDFKRMSGSGSLFRSRVRMGTVLLLAQVRRSAKFKR